MAEWPKEITDRLIALWNAHAHIKEMQDKLGMGEERVRSKLRRLQHAGLITKRIVTVKSASVARKFDARQCQKGADPHSVTTSQCRWPLGDPRDKDFRFCGLQRETGKPYCPEHWSRATGRIVARQKS